MHPQNISPVQFSSFAQSCPTLCYPMDCSTPGFPVYHQLQGLLKLISIESMMPSNHLIFCRPLLFLPLIFSRIWVFSNKSVLRIRWPKYQSFSFSISPSNEYSGFISFRMDWLDLLSVQGTLKSLLQRHNSKESILWRSAFFIVQLSHPYILLLLSLQLYPTLCDPMVCSLSGSSIHRIFQARVLEWGAIAFSDPYMTNGKTIALTRWTFIGKVMSLLSNMLSRLVIAFLPRSKRLLISWLQSPSTVILEPPI